MNSKVYYGSFYSKSYPIGMRIPTLYDFQFEHQALANLKKDESNAELIKKYHETDKYTLTISGNVRSYKKNLIFA